LPQSDRADFARLGASGFMETTMKLYGTLASNNVRRALAVAKHIGLPVEHIDLMPLTPGANTPEFRRLSPAGRVPVLVDGDFALTESTAIMLYFANQKPNNLWPKENRAQADVLRWLSWSLQHWYAGWRPLQWERFIKPTFFKGTTDAAVVAEAEKVFHQEAKILDEHLAGRTWLVGNEITLADFSVAAGLGFAGPAQLPLAPYGNIRAWYARIEQLPAWQATTPGG
jgi:glutathione S-transferase